MGALDELVARWRANPDAETTVALCSYLSTSREEDLIREVGGNAETWHRNDVEVMLGVGRMYLDADMLAEAQASLVVAGKARPDDARPFRFLGEVLLRRGDALRAEKVLARSMQLGQNDSETALWHDRAVVYVALQKRVGLQAVAAEVSRTIPKKNSIPPPTMTPLDEHYDDELTVPRGRAPDPALLRQAGAAEPAAAVAAPAPAPVPAPAPAPVPAAARPGLPPVAPVPDSVSTVPPPLPAVPAVPAPPVIRSQEALAPAPVPAPEDAGPPPSAGIPAADAKPDLHFDDSANPDPRDVLEHLSAVGVFEPTGGAAPAWEAAPRTRSRGTWVFIVATVLAIGAGGGGYAYARHVTKQRAAEARAIGDDVAKILSEGTVGGIRGTDQKLSRMFDLDSRSQRAAKLWLKNRVLTALLVPGEPRGIDNAVHRCRTLDVPEEEIIYGRIASFLVEGDLAGAAALLPKWDKKVGKNAMYQLAAGAVLERAGDPRAIERYEAARALDGDLLAAHIMLANAALLEAGPEKAKKAVDEAKSKLGDRPAAKALSALLWVLQGQTDGGVPENAKITPEEAKELPGPLRTVPFFVEAVVSNAAGERRKAAETIDRAVPLSWSPGMAVWLGFLALEAGDERLARKAALRALQFSAVYPRARVLASRVALLGGRLDEAKKAIEQLDPKSSEVAIVRAAAAYEILDTGELADAVEALGDAKEQDNFAGIAAAPGVALGTAYPEGEARNKMASPSVPWGELVAMDAALDSGDLENAEAMVKAWGDAAKRPVYQMRVARLLRYQGKHEEAVKASTDAFNRGTTTPRMLIEHTYVLVAADQAKHAKDIVAKFPTVLGPMTAWLKTLASASAGRKAEANVRVAQLELPAEAAPLSLKILALRALAAAGDRRAKGYLRDFQKKVPKHPDLKAAIDAL